MYGPSNVWECRRETSKSYLGELRMATLELGLKDEDVGIWNRIKQKNSKRRCHYRQKKKAEKSPACSRSMWNVIKYNIHWRYDCGEREDRNKVEWVSYMKGLVCHTKESWFDSCRQWWTNEDSERQLSIIVVRKTTMS